MVILTAAILLIPKPAHAAYIDPGVGSLAWQMLVGAIAGVTFYVGRLVRKIRSKKEDREDED